MGGPVKVGPIKAKSSIYKDINIIQIHQGKVNVAESATFSHSTGIEFNDNSGLGFGYEIEETITNNDNYNPINPPWKMLKNIDNVSIKTIYGMTVNNYGSFETNSNSNFVGIGVELHLIVGGYIKIGFNINN